MLTTGKYHTVSNSGKHIHCTADGTPIRPYKQGVSGVAKTSVRVAHEQKIAAHEASLADAAQGVRPPPVDPALLQERVQTKGRFGAKTPTEIDLFLTEQARNRLMFPEREAAAREEEAQAKHKIDELHKNFAALAASSDINATHTKDISATKNLAKTCGLGAFTLTGTFRP